MAPEGAGERVAEARGKSEAEAGPSVGAGSCFWMGKGTLKVPLSLHSQNRARALTALRSAVAEDPSLAAAGPLVALLQVRRGRREAQTLDLHLVVPLFVQQRLWRSGP